VTGESGDPTGEVEADYESEKLSVRIVPQEEANTDRWPVLRWRSLTFGDSRKGYQSVVTDRTECLPRPLVVT
jgi:hypothetical protein